MSADRDGSLDSDWAGVGLLLPASGAQVEYHLIDVIPSCDLSAKEPDLGGSDGGPELELHEPDTVAGGRWCVEGRYWVDVPSSTGPGSSCSTRGSGSSR